MGLSLPTPHASLWRDENFGFTLGMIAKRTVDLTGAIAGLILLAPILLAVAVLIRSDTPGPVLFRQKRLGRRGRPFQIWKFRTMHRDAEARVAELEARNQAAGGVLFKIDNDPRITRIGALLRRTHIDELPQLLNVLKGEMSLVGPRPFQARDSLKLQKLDPRRLRPPPRIPAGPHRCLASRPRQPPRLRKPPRLRPSITSTTGPSAATSP